MSELNTKALSELTVVDSLENTDTVLIESGGYMKKINSSAIGGGLIVNVTAEFPGSEGTIVDVSKTYAEIADAIKDGNDVVVFLHCAVDLDSRENVMYRLPLSYFDEDGGAVGFMNCSVAYGADNTYVDSYNLVLGSPESDTSDRVWANGGLVENYVDTTQYNPPVY